MAEYGPLTLIIFAEIGKVPQVRESLLAARTSFLFLERIAGCRKELSKNIREGFVNIGDPLAGVMISSVSEISDYDLTPMAAVAGTIADAVADFLVQRGMTRVVVNNGGDIAIRLEGEASVTIGIKDRVNDRDITGNVTLDSSNPTWGVATSGLGGRSFTRGIASAVTVIAKNASVADAAATSVANHSFIEHEQVIQQRAKDLDPQTDIPNALVTTKAGPLPVEKRDLGLVQALQRAEELVAQDLIYGAFVAIQGKNGMTDFFKKRWKPLKS